MSLQNFIQYFSGGRIILKYRIITAANRSKLKSWLMTAAIWGITAGSIVLGTVLLNNRTLVIAAALMPVLGYYVADKLEAKFFQTVIPVGMLEFYPEHLQISTYPDGKIQYKELTYILFKGYIKGSRRQYHSYVVLFATQTRQFICTAETALHLNEEDQLQGRRSEPSLLNSLQTIYKHYRIPIVEKERSFNFKKMQ